MMNKDDKVIPSKIPPQKTICLEISAAALEIHSARQGLRRAAEILRSGGTVAFPTETVYGLGANALDSDAVARIFTAKQRPSWDPLIVHVSGENMLRTIVAEVSSRAHRLMQEFWPGPLTLLLPKTDAVPPVVTAGRALVGVRMPAHPVAMALLKAAGIPLAAPSANRFGHTSPTTARHVLDDLDGRIDLILNAGPCSHGVESTVVEVQQDRVVVYRPGALSLEEIQSVAGPVMLYRPPRNIDNSPPKALPSPGVGIRHYAPNARVIVLDLGAPQDNAQWQWLESIKPHLSGGHRLGVMLPRNWPLPDDFCGLRYDWGEWNDDAEMARRLFAGLRHLDALGADIILCPLPPSQGLGAALRDRILKAARAE